MPYVTTSVRTSPPRALLRIGGEIDVLAAPELHRATAAVVTDGCLEVKLDLNDVSFLDCAGLDALMSCRHNVEASGGRRRSRAARHPSCRVGPSHRVRFAGGRGSRRRFHLEE